MFLWKEKDNKGIGLMFEAESDTLAQTFKSEHGNYSDGFRKAFHYQTLDDYFRHLGNHFFDFYKTLQHLSEPLRFCLTITQQQQFNTYFSENKIAIFVCAVMTIWPPSSVWD